MTSQQVYSQSFGQDYPLLQIYGPWTTFFYPTQDSTGLYGKEVYLDTNANLYLYGEGPLNGVTGGNLASAAGVTNGSGATSTASVAAVNPLASLEANPTIAGVQSFLTESLIGGIPNWMLLAGVVGVFFLFGDDEPKGREREF